ncbi:MAG: carboxypeptidase regulatory-like domain-containing protein [Deltaproteobacteria bacterium]|nr:carboxypeptidase regulatory-like domain-containing protein [Deltaproteobacteria bacterium]
MQNMRKNLKLKKSWILNKKCFPPSPIAHHPSPVFNKGFTLIELIMVIVLIGIVAATAVMVIGNVITQQQFDATLKEMNELKMATVGNPDLMESGVRSSFGYAGDMGALPATLNGLITNPSACGWAADTALGGGTNLGTGAGWRGPYIDNKQDDSGNYLALLDGWGRAYQYPLPGAGQITSYGTDGVAGGTGFDADIVVSVGTTITGTVSGRVTNPSGRPIQAPPATNNVIIYSPPLTCASTFTQYAAATDANGYYTISNVPIGKHKLSVTVGVTTIDNAVTVLPNATTTMDVVFTTSATTPDITDITTFTATPFSTSQIRLDWSPPVTTNTDGSTIRDLKGYNIYRGTALNPTSLYASLQNSQTAGTVSYVDSNAGYFNTYYYRITAVNTSGIESAYSANASVPGSYGSSSIFQTTGAATWNTSCIQFQVRNYTAANILVTTNRISSNLGAATRYKIAVSTVAQPACLGTGGGATCTQNASEYNIADYTINANGGNTGYVSVSFFTAAGCGALTNINISNNPYLGFNMNVYQIGDSVTGLR